MQTKSNIQLVMETMDAKLDFLRGVKKLCESYKISDNIFIYNRGTQELTSGYFVPVKEGTVNDLQQIISNMDIRTQGIRITEDKIQLGDVYNKIPADKSFIEIKAIE